MRSGLLAAIGGAFAGAAARGGDLGIIETRPVPAGSGEVYHRYVPASGPDHRASPVVVFLHGIRERGTGGYLPTTGPAAALLRGYLRQVPAIVVLPQCRPGVTWSDPAMDRLVLAALGETLAEVGGDPARVSLAGVSMGGYGVWHLASQHPGRWSALVSICGGSPLRGRDRFTPIARRVGRAPAWLLHGEDDRVVPVSESRQLVAALQAAGGDVRYSEYPGVGHDAWLNALGERELLPWALSKRS